MTQQEFVNKYVGGTGNFDTEEKVVHCDTQEKAKELLALAHRFGWSWISGRNLSEITYWEDLQEETCYRFDNNKTVGYARLNYYKSEDYKIVEFESEKNKPKKTKKVFDLGLFVDAMRKEKMDYRQLLADINLWALECHGLTVKEMNEKDYSTSYSWMKEVEVDIQLTPHEIEILKGLKALEFNWIARARNDELYAYYSKPIKSTLTYGGLQFSFPLNQDLFKFIVWEDEEATSIDELLIHVENIEGAKKIMKTKSTKKVFDLWLFIADRKKSEVADENILDSIKLWALDAHGLTDKEMWEKGWSLDDDWMKEVEVEANIELTPREIEFLKALKVLGFNWIARDEDDELYAYVSKPTKKSFSYVSSFSSFLLEKDLFDFIAWEDEEAVDIDELLKYIGNTEGEQE